MSQTGYELFSDAVEMGGVIFDVIAVYAIWDIFYRSAKEKVTMLAGGALLIANMVLELALDMRTYGRLMISAVFLLVYSFIRYQKRCEKAVLVFSLFYGIRSLSWLVGNTIMQYSYAFFREHFGGSEMIINHIYSYTVCTLSLFFVAYIGLFSLMIFLLRRIIQPMDEMSWHDVCFLSVLNIIGGMFTNFVINISLVKLESEVFDLFTVRREMLWKLPLMAVLLFLGELSAITIYQKYRELQREREVYFTEQQRVKAMKQRLEEAENFYGSIRKVRHELKNHMVNIKSLVAGAHYAEVESYIAKLDGTIGTLDYKYSTGNAVTDVIINDKAKSADKASIRFEVQFSCEEVSGVDIFDLGIILNNLLDNAITACEKIEEEKRYIRLSLRRKKKFLLLIVENSYDGKFQNAGDGLPQTTKGVKLPEELCEHGIGLRNVKEIVERYFGTMDIKTADNVFKVTDMLQQQGVA